MVIYSGIIIALQIYLLGMALFYVRHKAAIYPDKGFHMWKQMAIYSLIPLGFSLFTFLLLQSLTFPIFMTLSIETLAMGLFIICLLYLRPRFLADKAATRLGIWKLVAILSAIIAVTGLFIPFVFSL
jgi:hypothetical protein